MNVLKTSKTDRRWLAGFVIAIFGLVTIHFFLQENIEDVRNVTSLRAEARKTAFKLKNLNALLTDAESGQRGFLLTGEEKYLFFYGNAVKEIPVLYKILETDFAGHPEQAERLRQAESLINDKLTELAHTIELVRRGQSNAAIRIVKLGRGQHFMEQLREVFKVMDEKQQLLINERNAKADEILASSNRVVIWSSALAIILVTSLLLLLNRDQKRRASTEAVLEKRKALATKVIAIQNQIATSTPDSRSLLDMITRLSSELTGCDGAIIEIVDGNELVYSDAHGAAIPFVGIRMPRAGSFSGLCLDEGKTLICNDSESDPRVNREACRKVNLRSMIVAPLVHSGKTIGVLKNYSAQPNFFDEPTFSSLSWVTGLFSASLGQAKEFEEKVSAIRELEKAKAELTISRDQAQSATEAKSRFVASMSHEVRTPLHGILGMTGILLDGELQKEQREYAKAIQSSGEMLLALVNDVLDFSKIEAGRMELEDVAFDLISTLQDVTKSFASAAQLKKLDLKLTHDPQLPHLVSGDPSRIRQILINLIGNAIKFTHQGAVTVHASVAAPTTSGIANLRFEIRDTGIGIPKEAVANLFQEFVQADASTTRRYGGTGLGLSICKRLVERMAGEIGVDSNSDRGSCFWFTIKLKIADKETPKARTHIDAPLPSRDQPWRVLVAEDNQVNQIIITKMLEKFGLGCDLVSNGKEVIAALQTREYDLILMDCHMPEMDGYEATAAIRARNADIPIIAMTANALKGDREKTLAAGMNDYLSKPLDPPRVHAVFSKWLTVLKERPAA